MKRKTINIALVVAAISVSVYGDCYTQDGNIFCAVNNEPFTYPVPTGNPCEGTDCPAVVTGNYYSTDGSMVRVSVFPEVGYASYKSAGNCSVIGKYLCNGVYEPLYSYNIGGLQVDGPLCGS